LAGAKAQSQAHIRNQQSEIINRQSSSGLRLASLEFFRACLKKGRERFACGHAVCASRFLSSRQCSDCIPQRSGEWMAHGNAHETLGNPTMGSHSLAILADRPECLCRS
jgi:hypothetical protein